MREHLLARGLEPDRYSSVFVDTDRATFALWNLSGQMVGYQTYRPDRDKNRNDDPREQRYFTFVSRFDGKVPALAVWGLETLSPDKPVYLCEGVFDACKLHQLGLSAIATLGSDPAPLRGWLKCLPQRKIAVCDGDAAGQKLAKFADQAIFLPEGMDAGDLSTEALREILAGSELDCANPGRSTKRRP